MRSILFLLLLAASTASAQNSFAIFDTLNNNVTGGVWAITDTAQTISVRFKVQNVDTQPYSVTAGRLVISVPPTTTNWFVWDEVCYVPTIDSSIVNPMMAPQDTAIFIADYFSNGIAGTATINYCFWDRANMSNTSCITTTYNRLVGIGDESNPFQVNAFPNPAGADQALNLNWTAVPGEMVSVKLISVNGSFNTFSFPAASGQCKLPLHDFSSGMYFLEISTEHTLLYRDKIVVK